MYQIGICDKEPAYLEYAAKLVSEILQSHKIPCHIHTFTSGQELHPYLSQNRFYPPPLAQTLDLLLLDVFPDKENGIQLAKRLRRTGNEIPIIFLSNTMDFVLDGYTAEPLAYLLKPIERDKLTEALIRAYRKYKKNMMAIQTPSQTVRFHLNEVLYLEICDKTLHIHLSNGTILKAAAHLSRLLEKLPQEQFVQCHRSYVVSLPAVNSICRYTIELKNHETVPVSKTRYKEVQKAMLQGCVDIHVTL